MTHGHRRTEKSTGPSQRQLRVGELVRHALAEMLSRGEIHDDVLAAHVVTVPEVRMSPDLQARHHLRDAARRQGRGAVLAALERNKRYIRGEVAHAVNLKFAPDIRFLADETFEEADRIERLLASDKVLATGKMSVQSTKSTTPHGTAQEGQGGPRLAGAGQAARHDLDAGGRRRATAFRRAQGRPCRHARPAGDRRAAHRAGRGDQDRALRRRRHQALPLHRALGGRAPTPTTPRARSSPPASCAPRARRSRRCCRSFTGEILQTPPAYSAIKVDGAAPTTWRARARRSSCRPRPVHIESLTLLGCPAADTAVFEARCGKGTYVRALARDMGQMLGCLGHLIALRRTRVAPFDEAQAVTLAALEAAAEQGGEDAAHAPAASDRGRAARPRPSSTSARTMQRACCAARPC